MKKNSVIIFLIGLGINYLNAQDLILKRDGTEIQAKILEVGINDIKYKRFDYITGPTITLIKSSIFYIKYENGTKEVFAKEEKPNLGNNITNNPPPPKDLNLPATILKRDGEEIKATLLEINETTIKIFPSNKSKEATVNLHKSAIFYLKYDNGTKDMFTEKNIFEAIAHNDKDENGIRRYKQTLPRKPNSVEKIKQEGILIEKYYDSEGYLSRENIVNNDKVREIKKTYSSNGLLQYEHQFMNNQLYGITYNYNNEGYLESEMYFEYDVPKLTKTYNKAGFLISETPGEGDGKYKVYYSSGILKQESYLTNNKINGTLKLYKEDGKLNSEQDFINGKPKGLPRYFDETGNYTTLAPLSNGEINPSAKLYDKNGKEITDTPTNGIQNAYYKTGELYAETPYEDGKISGSRRIYYKNQKISIQLPYSENKINGMVMFFDTNGVLISKNFYLDSLQNGVSKTYYKNGTILGETLYRNGEKNGIAKSYHENGTISMITPYTNDKINGIRKMYYQNGNLQMEQIFKDDLGNGTCKHYDDKGNLSFEYTEANGFKTGEEKHYNNGALFLITLYENGEKNGVQKMYLNGQLNMEIPYKNDKKNGVAINYLNGNISTQTKYVDNVKDIEFEKEQERLRKKQNRQETLSAVAGGLMQGLQQTSAQLDFQNNPNAQTFSNYANVVSNNNTKSTSEAINSNNQILGSTLNTSNVNNTSITDAYNQSAIKINTLYNSQNPASQVDPYANTINTNNTSITDAYNQSAININALYNSRNPSSQVDPYANTINTNNTSITDAYNQSQTKINNLYNSQHAESSAITNNNGVSCYNQAENELKQSLEYKECNKSAFEANMQQYNCEMSKAILIKLTLKYCQSKLPQNEIQVLQNQYSQTIQIANSIKINASSSVTSFKSYEEPAECKKCKEIADKNYKTITDNIDKKYYVCNTSGNGAAFACDGNIPPSCVCVAHKKHCSCDICGKNIQTEYNTAETNHKNALSNCSQFCK